MRKSGRLFCLLSLLLCSACLQPTPTVTPISTLTATLSPIAPPPAFGGPVTFPNTPITPENADQVVELARWGRGPILDVGYAPDGKTLAVLSPSGLYFYDAQTLEDKQYIELDVTYAHHNALAYSPDGHLLAIGLNNQVNVWQINDWSLLYTLPEESAILTFSPDSTVLVTGHSEVKLWRVVDAKLLRVLSLNAPRRKGYWKDSLMHDFDHVKAQPWNVYSWYNLLRTSFEMGKSLIPFEQETSYAFAVAFSPDGAKLTVGATTPGMEFLYIWEVPDGKRIYLQEHLEGLGRHTVTFAANDGSLLAMGQRYGRVEIMQLPDQTVSHTFHYPTADNYLAAVAFSPEANLLATETCLHATKRAQCNKTNILLWRVETQQLHQVLSRYQASVTRLLFSPDGMRVLAVGNDQSLTVWDVDTGECLKILAVHSCRARELTLSPQGDFLATHNFTSWGSIEPEIWRIEDGMRLYTLDFPGSAGTASLAFSPDDHLLVSGDRHGVVRLWQTDTGQLLRTLNTYEDEDAQTFLSPDNEIVASFCAGCSTIRLWHIADGQLLHELEHPGRVWRMVFSPDSSMIVSYTLDDHSVRVWDVVSGKHLHTFHSDGNYLVFSVDSTKLYSHGRGTLRVWRVNDGEILYHFPANVRNNVLLSPDGTLLTLSDYSSVRLYHDEDGVLLRTIPQADNRGVLYSPDGKLLFIRAFTRLEFWDVDGGQLIGKLNYDKRIGDFALTPDGAMLITSSNEDGTIRLWGIP